MLTTRRSSIEQLIVVLGATAFVASLAACAGFYLLILGSGGDLARSAGRALAVDTLLFSIFAMHHSLFTREPVKVRLRRLVPQRLERTLFVWIASLLLLAVCLFWQPIGGEVYSATGWARWPHALVQLAGLGLVAGSVRVIDPLELAGLRQAAAPDTLRIAGPYRWLRHPIYLGWILAVFGTAHLTGDRLAFGAISTAYIVIAIPWEERALERTFGDQYRRYARQVTWKLLPYVY